MSIEMKRFDNDCIGAVFVCDYCGKRIEDARKASFEFQYDEKRAPVPGVAFFHLPECSQAVEKLTGQSPHWHHLDVLLMQLLHNAGLSTADIERLENREG